MPNMTDNRMAVFTLRGVESIRSKARSLFYKSDIREPALFEYLLLTWMSGDIAQVIGGVIVLTTLSTTSQANLDLE